MSFPRRFYNLLRAYIDREWERIDRAERDRAASELDSPSSSWEKGEGVRTCGSEENQGAHQTSKHSETPTPQYRNTDRLAHARRILGVNGSAGYAEVRRAYVRLSRRSDSSNFPASSLEARQAADIHRRIEWAYKMLSENVDDTDRRFQSLEIE